MKIAYLPALCFLGSIAAEHSVPMSAINKTIFQRLYPVQCYILSAYTTIALICQANYLFEFPQNVKRSDRHSNRTNCHEITGFRVLVTINCHKTGIFRLIMTFLHRGVISAMWDRGYIDGTIVPEYTGPFTELVSPLQKALLTASGENAPSNLDTADSNMPSLWRSLREQLSGFLDSCSSKGLLVEVTRFELAASTSRT